MKLVDLTRKLDPEDRHRLPEAFKGWGTNIIPRIQPIRPGHEGADMMCQIFGCEKHDLPEGEGWGDEQMQLSTHLGTHVDAPLHYGSTCEGKPARTITDIDLNELYVEAMVLDVREDAVQGEGISIDALKSALDKNGAAVPKDGAIIIRTGQEAFDVCDEGFFSYPGMTREGTLFLADLGAKILGTDALGWDRPFPVMRRAFKKTGNSAEIWDGHFAGRDKEVFIIQQLAHLDQVPASGFKVGFFPLRLAGCSASPARVIAFID